MFIKSFYNVDQIVGKHQNWTFIFFSWNV